MKAACSLGTTCTNLVKSKTRCGPNTLRACKLQVWIVMRPWRASPRVAAVDRAAVAVARANLKLPLWHLLLVAAAVVDRAVAANKPLRLPFLMRHSHR